MIKYIFIPTIGNYSPSIYNKVYLLKLNKTFYGVHKNFLYIGNNNSKNTLDDDDFNNLNILDSSNTYLLSFIKNIHAKQFKQYIDSAQKEKKTYNRIITNYEDNIFIAESIPLKSISPCYLKEEKIKDFEQICILNYFNMFIVSNIAYTEDGLEVLGFEYKIKDRPNRSLIEYNFNNMLN